MIIVKSAAAILHSQPTAVGVGGHDGREEAGRQKLDGVHVSALEPYVVSVPVGSVQIHLPSARHRWRDRTGAGVCGKEGRGTKAYYSRLKDYAVRRGGTV